MRDRLPDGCEGTRIDRSYGHILAEGVDAIRIGSIFMQAYTISTALREYIRGSKTIGRRRICAKGPVVVISGIGVRSRHIDGVTMSGICPCGIEMARRCRRRNSYILAQRIRAVSARCVYILTDVVGTIVGVNLHKGSLIAGIIGSVETPVMSIG
jgi:hypothetical protein